MKGSVHAMRIVNPVIQEALNIALLDYAPSTAWALIRCTNEQLVTVQLATASYTTKLVPAKHQST